MKWNRWAFKLALIPGFFFAQATYAATEPDVEVRQAVAYANQGGVALTGDLYTPQGAGPYPALIAVHGGDWQFADAGLYRHWGPYLARHGYALFAINYRLVHEGKNLYPAAVDDVRAAVRFLGEQGESLKIDPHRLGLIGDSAGAQLSALVALEPGTDGVGIKAFVGIYGAYDLTAQWNDDHRHRPGDNIVETFLGSSLADDRKLYFDASPLSHVVRSNNQTAFFLAWGTRDDRVDGRAQSSVFLQALKQAGYVAQGLPIAGAPHYWASDPIRPGRNYPGYLAPHLIEFLDQHLQKSPTSEHSMGNIQ
ncbi:MAG TPA: alpha/beta hydrolase [Burkholderiaceae bacterium]